MESTACGLLNTPQACCHPWTNWMSVQQHQFRHMTFPPCTHQSHTICFSLELLHLYTTHSRGDMEVTDITHIKITSGKGCFIDTINPGGDNLYTADQICRMVEFLIDNIFVKFGGCLFRQVIGIPMGTNCAPLLADLFLYPYESEFLDNMIRGGHRKLARSFNLCYQYIDDLIVFNNKKFGDYVKEIYPSQLTVEKANTSDDLANYLDLTFITEINNRLYTKLYDKCDDFDFHIVNFPFLSSNIPSSPSYGVYIPQLIRYARCCSYYDDSGYRHKLLVDRRLYQGYDVKRLRNSFKTFYGRYPDLIGKYQRSVEDMVADSFPD